jgi:hypothetical protein
LIFISHGKPGTVAKVTTLAHKKGNQMFIILRATEPQTHRQTWRERGRKEMSKRRSNYYYQSEIEEPKIRQICVIPDSVRVFANFREADGNTTSERVFLLGLLSDGTVELLSVDDMGVVEAADLPENFTGFTFA